MTNKTKALGLAFIALAAMSVAAAPAAQAGAFDVGTQPAIITGHSEENQEVVLTIPRTAGGSIIAKCPTASYEGTVQGQTGVSEATVTATFGPNAAGTQCKFNGLNTAVRMNGCKYTITGAAQPAFTVLLDVVGCTSGKQVEVEQIATGCIVTVPEQNALSHIVFHQVNAQQVTNTLTVTGITFTQGAACPEPGHHGANASIAGNTLVTAWTDGGSTQVTKHGHQYSEYKCGTQVSLTAT